MEIPIFEIVFFSKVVSIQMKCRNFRREIKSNFFLADKGKVYAFPAKNSYTFSFTIIR